VQWMCEEIGNKAVKLGKSITSERITIRDYISTDKEFCTGMWFDKENGKYLSDPTAEYVDEVYQNAIDTMEDCEDGYYLIIEDKDEGKSIGSCCIFPNEDRSNIDIGYCVNKTYWRNGYASEAIKQLIEWAKEQHIKTVTAEVAKENVASCGLLRKLGFKVKEETKFKKYHMDIEFNSYLFELVLY